MTEDVFTKDEVAKRSYEKAEKFRRDQAAQSSYANDDGQLGERLGNIKNIMKKLHLSAEKTMEAMGIPAVDFPKERSHLKSINWEVHTDKFIDRLGKLIQELKRREK